MINPKHYTYRITWSPEDEEYVGLCAEFPSLSHLDETHMGALQGIMELVEDVITDLAENNEPIPQPLSDREYSGKFMVRVAPHLHRMLTIQAAEQGVSLNRYIASKLT
jgi:predicted HicB family RNase H-like nuclease